MKSVLVLLFAFAAHATITPKAPVVEKREFSLNNISRIEVKNTSGNVSITAVNKGKAVVTAEKYKFGDSCKLNIEQKGQTLLVEVEKEGGFFAGSCEVNFQIAAPRKTALELSSGSGEVNVNGTSGDLTFNVGSGSVNVKAEVKGLEGKVGSGDVSIVGATAGGSLKTGSGDIALVYSAAPVKGELDIKAGSGDAQITFPKKSQIQTAFSAGSGRLTNELGDVPGSKFKVSMKAGSGSLHIKKQ